MNDAMKFLYENTTGMLSTIGIDGKPKLRPFTFFFEKDDKLWFETSNSKNVYSELVANPYVEFCVLGAKMSWLRLSGKVVFANRPDIKAAMFEKTKNLAFLYKNPENPVFEVFYLEDAKVIFNQFGKEPQEFEPF